MVGTTLADRAYAQGQHMGTGAASDEGHWVSIADAASELGVSVDTVRRRIKRQELLAKREQRAQGFRWLVRLDGESPAFGIVPTPESPGSSSSGEAQPLQVAIVSERDELVRELRDQLATREREASELRAIIARQASALEQAARLQVLAATVSSFSAPEGHGDPSSALGDREAGVMTAPERPSAGATARRSRRRRMWEWLVGR